MTTSFRDFVAGFIGGAAGIAFAQPLDVVKTLRIVKADFYPENPFLILTQLAREEGLLGLYKGLLSPLVGAAGINFVLFGVEGNVARFVRRHRGLSSGDHMNLLDVWFCGAVAGFAQTPIASVTEYLKIQMQRQNALNPKYGTYGELTQAIYQRHSFRGFCKGIFPTALREVGSYGVYFAAYEYGKRIMGSSSLACFFSGGIAGTICWVSSYPIDVVKTLVQEQNVFGKTMFKSTWDCSRHVYRTEVFRGLGACILRAFPLNAMTFLAYEVALKFLDYLGWTGEIPEPL